MLINGILIGACWLCYSIVFRQYTLLQRTNLHVLEAVTLNALLEKDVLESDAVRKNDRGFEIHFKNAEKVVYVFSSAYVLRQTALTNDTFKLMVKSYDCKFQNPEQSNRQALLQELIIDISLFNEEQRLIFVKTYTADELINNP